MMTPIFQKVIFTKALFGCPIYYYSMTSPESKSGGQPSGKRAQHITKKNFKLVIGKNFGFVPKIF